MEEENDSNNVTRTGNVLLCYGKDEQGECWTDSQSTLRSVGETQCPQENDQKSDPHTRTFYEFTKHIVMQYYGQHNSRFDWFLISQGLTNKNDKLYGKEQKSRYIMNINNDEAILVSK